MAEQLRYKKKKRYEGREYCVSLAEAAAEIGVNPHTLRNWCKFAKDERFSKPDWFVFPEPRTIKYSNGSKCRTFKPEQVEQIKAMVRDVGKEEFKILLTTAKREYDRQNNMVALELKRQKKLEKKKEKQEREKARKKAHDDELRELLADKVDELKKKEREATLALLRRRRYRIYLKEQMDKLHVNGIPCKDGVLYLYNVRKCVVDDKKGEKILKEKLSDEDFNYIVSYEPVIHHSRLAHAIQEKKITAEDVKPFIKRTTPELKEFYQKEQGKARGNVIRGGEYYLSETIDVDNRRAEKAKKVENEK